MFSEEMKEEIESAISDKIDTIVWQYFQNAKTPEGLEGLAKLVTQTSHFHRGVSEIIDRCVATQIGNELRVGSGRWPMDQAFKAVWTDQLNRAIDDRIHRKVIEAVDAVILERLASFKEAVSKLR